MVDIVVKRGRGDLPGADIVEPLLGRSINAAIQRGRGEIDEGAPADTIAIELLGTVADDWALGEIVSVHDADQGVTWKGRITGISHGDSGDVPTTTIQIWRPHATA